MNDWFLGYRGKPFLTPPTGPSGTGLPNDEQTLFIQFLYNVGEDGYGARTKASVRGLQEKNGIVVDPKVMIGPLTWVYLLERYADWVAAYDAHGTPQLLSPPIPRSSSSPSPAYVDLNEPELGFLEMAKEAGYLMLTYGTGFGYELANDMLLGIPGNLGLNAVMDRQDDVFQAGRYGGAVTALTISTYAMAGGAQTLMVGGGAACLGTAGGGCIVAGAAAIELALAPGQAYAATTFIGTYYSKHWDDWMDDDFDPRPKAKTGKGGKKSGGHANSQIKEAGKKAGLTDSEIREFGDYVESSKRASGRGGADNYTYKELLEMALEWKGGTR